MKDILFIRSSSYNLGGVEGQVIKLAKALFSRQLFYPVLVTSNQNSPFAQIFKDDSFPVYEAPMGKRDINKAAKIISRILSQRDITVIQSHMFRESLIGRLVRKKHPQIPHIYRAELHIDCAPMNPRWKKWLCHALDKFTSRYVDYYVANGKYLRDEIVNRSWVKPERTCVIIDGRDPIGPPDPPNDRLDLPLPPRIAMVSNLWPRKGHDVLIKGLALLRKKGLHIKVRLIGGEATGDNNIQRTLFTDSLKAEARRLGVLEQIEFYGYTHDVYTALEDFAVVVLPSDSEGVPNCILEAIGLRKLVIASRVGGVPEVIQDGVQGLLHPPQDPAAFAACLERVFTVPAQQWEPVRDAGYKRWQKNFSVDKMIDGFTAIYNELGILE